MTNLPKGLRSRLDAEFALMPASLVLNRHSADVTDKLLLELGDKSLIETVIIRAPQDGGARPFAKDNLHLDPGRLRDGLRLFARAAWPG